MTNHDPEIPTYFIEKDWLDFAGSRGGTVKFHKKTGYFYYWESGTQGKERLKCACKQFMIKYHDSECVHSATECEMSEKCWASDWFLLGSPDKWHNHPPPSRVSVELKLFEWQLKLTFAKNRNAVRINHVLDEMYTSWPFALVLSKSQLRNVFSTEPEEGSTFLDQDKIDSMMAMLMVWTEYWGNPLELDNREIKSEQCCNAIKAKGNKRRPSRRSSTNRSQKKLKMPEVEEEDGYDTEPLPVNDTERNIEPEPIAGGSRDRTPSPKKVDRIFVEPKYSVEISKKDVRKDLVVLPRSETRLPKAIALTNGKPWGPISLRHPVKEGNLVKQAEVCEPIEKVIRFAKNLVKQSKKICNQNGVDIFAVPLCKSIGSRSAIQRFIFGKCPCPPKERKTVLILGATGLSQTRLINGIINYIFNVAKEDNFRFQLVEEKGNDQPNHISVYDIHHAEGFRTPFSITIVHTPCYNAENTALFGNGKLIQTFREFFEDVDRISELDLVCNVVLKDRVRDSFLSIFGYDVEENINCFWLRNTEGFPFDELIQRFFSVLTSTKTKSLEGTKEVLQVMKRLEETVNSFIPLMKSLSAKNEEIQKANLVFTACQSQIEANKETEMKFSLDTAEQTYRKEVLWKNLECEAKELFRLLQTEFDGLARTMLDLFEIAWSSIRQLKRISRGNPYLSQELYDLLFNVEEGLKRHGYHVNIEQLKNRAIEN